MRRRAAPLLVALLAFAIPPVLLGNALLAVAQPWLVGAVYAAPGVPGPSIDLSGKERRALGVTGVRSIQPWAGDGVEELRGARLPSGGQAFDAREVSHMEDVRRLVRGLLVAWLLAAALLAGTALAASRHAGAVRRGTRAGALLTLGAFGAAGLAMLADFDGAFTAFHELFFSGDSWRFAGGDTLRSLYPDAFWSWAAGALAALVLAQAAALLLWSARGRRSARAA